MKFPISVDLTDDLNDLNNLDLSAEFIGSDEETEAKGHQELINENSGENSRRPVCKTAKER